MAKFFGNLHLVLAVGLIAAILVIVSFTGWTGSDAKSLADDVFRWLHTFFGILWIGLLYYLNFVQVPTMPKIPDEQKPAVSKVIAPTALLMSSERARQVADEIEARLAPQGTWRRRLCEWALADPRRGLRRWLKARVRHLLGLRRVSRIDTPASAPARLGWLHDVLERAA